MPPAFDRIGLKSKSVVAVFAVVPDLTSPIANTLMSLAEIADAPITITTADPEMFSVAPPYLLTISAVNLSSLLYAYGSSLLTGSPLK